MKKIVCYLLILCVAVFTGCGIEKGTKAYKKDTISAENSNIRLDDVVIKAEELISVFYKGEYDTKNIKKEIIEDNVTKQMLTVVSVKADEKKISVSFDSDANLKKYDSGSVTSDGKAVYTADKVDEVIEIAKEHYEKLNIDKEYEVSSWQMDFGGNDWQVEFSKKIDLDGYEKDVYNYLEMVRMRISGADGSLLSANVFNTPLKTYDTDEKMISYEDAVVASGLDKNKITKSYIGCFSPENTDYARLCHCFEADYGVKNGDCDTRWVYVDLYTGEVIGSHNCG